MENIFKTSAKNKYKEKIKIKMRIFYIHAFIRGLKFNTYNNSK